MKKYIFFSLMILFLVFEAKSQQIKTTTRINSFLSEFEDVANFQDSMQFSTYKETVINSFLRGNIQMFVPEVSPSSKIVSMLDYIKFTQNQFDYESDIIFDIAPIKFYKIKTSTYPGFKEITIKARQTISAFKVNGSDFTSVNDVDYTLIFNTDLSDIRIIKTEKAKTNKGLFISLAALPSMSNIAASYEINNVQTEFNSVSKLALSYGLVVDYNFTENVGITTGFYMTTYSSNLEEVNFSHNPVYTTDMDGDNYYLNYNFSNVTNQVNLKYIEIPLGIKITTGNVFFRAGVLIGIPGSHSQSFEDGELETTGLYEKYQVELQNIPEYGFLTNSITERTASEITSSSSNLSGFFQVGTSIAISKGLSLDVGLDYRKGFQNIVIDNTVVTDPNSVISYLESGDYITTSAVGLYVGLNIKLF